MSRKTIDHIPPNFKLWHCKNGKDYVVPEYRMQLDHIDEKEDSCDIARRKKLMKYIEEPDNDIIRREKRCDKFYEALDKITQEWSLQR